MPTKFLTIGEHLNVVLRTITLSACVAVFSACGVDGKTEQIQGEQLSTFKSDPSDALFATDRVISVAIEMAPDDFAALRAEGRSMTDVLDSCGPEFEYTHFVANATIDGVRLDNVDIRKKGFLGSLSYSRPSLKLNFKTLVEDRSFEGMQRMTLNNDHQDPGQNHQCITYRLFREAGIRAPRCNYAHVSVNGQEIGYYSHVESIKKPFLERNFADASGNLYEGQLGDFTDRLKHNFQRKTNLHISDRTDIESVIAALEHDDDNLPEALAQVIDIDEFITFWAMEIITGHWDSATGGANNYYIYNDPSDGLFHFIPWGTDAALSSSSPFGNEDRGPINRATQIPSRLYGIPRYREKLFERINELMTQLWNTEDLFAEIESMQGLIDTPDSALIQVRDFINAQPLRIADAQAGIYDDFDAQTLGPADAPSGCIEIQTSALTGTLAGNRASFSFYDPKGNLITVDNASLRESSGVNDFFVTLPAPRSFVMTGIANGSVIILSLNIESPEFKVGAVDIHGFATSAFLVPSPFGLGVSGTITIDEITEDGLLFGSFDLQVVFAGDDSPLGSLFAF